MKTETNMTIKRERKTHFTLEEIEQLLIDKADVIGEGQDVEVLWEDCSLGGISGAYVVSKTEETTEE